MKQKLAAVLSPRSKDKLETYLVRYLTAGRAITLIDIGAHRGDFINQVKRHYTLRDAILVEPIPELAAYLRSTFGKEKVRVYQNALTDKDRDTIDFQVNEFMETSSILPFNTGMKELDNVNIRPSKKETITTRTLDSIVGESGFQEIDLLKIDVQGAEHFVLSGSHDTLERTKYVWVELSFKPLYVGSSVFHDIYSIMQEQGFILLEISPGHRSSDNELLQADALFANPKYLHREQ